MDLIIWIFSWALKRLKYPENGTLKANKKLAIGISLQYEFKISPLATYVSKCITFIFHLYVLHNGMNIAYSQQNSPAFTALSIFLRLGLFC